MAKYRVKEKSFINNIVLDAGEQIEFDGVPHSNLEPLDKPAEKAAAASTDADRESLVRQQEAARGINLNDPEDPARRVVAQQG